MPEKDNIFSVIKEIVTKHGADTSVYCISAMIPLLAILNKADPIIPALVCLFIIVSWNMLYWIKAKTKQIESKTRLDELREKAGMEFLTKHYKHLSKDDKERLDLLVTQSKSK